MKNTNSFIDNINEVLERLGGNTALLDKLLQIFIDTYGNTGIQLKTFLSDAQFEEAHRLVHSVKGVSGNLGFAGLYAASLELEQILKGGKFDGIEAETARFIEELETVVSEIRKG